MTTRRDFIKNTSIAAGLLPLSTFPIIKNSCAINSDKLSIHIFSKHLQFLDYQATGEMAAEMGFDGVDLTVRSKGHVLPENVETDLPKAIEAIKKGGSICEMMTTKVERVDNPVDVMLLKTAAQLGIKSYRMNWYKYIKDLSFEEALLKYQKQIQELGILNKKLNLIGCYQNHSGRSVGASYWEMKKIVETADKDFFGCQYDIRHAVAEGGKSWENGLQLLLPHIKTIVLKDFKWGKVDGKWKPVNVPVGEGMVDFDKYFKILKKHQIKPPVSLHLEYDLGGAEKGRSEIKVDKKVVFDAMKKDLKTIHELWEKA